MTDATATTTADATFSDVNGSNAAANATTAAASGGNLWLQENPDSRPVNARTTAPTTTAAPILSAVGSATAAAYL